MRDAEDLGHDADVRFSLQLVEERIGRRDRSPRHRRHQEGGPGAERLGKRVDEGLGTVSALTEIPERAVHDEHAVVRDPGVVEDRANGRRLLAHRPIFFALMASIRSRERSTSR